MAQEQLVLQLPNQKDDSLKHEPELENDKTKVKFKKIDRDAMTLKL